MDKFWRYRVASIWLPIYNFLKLWVMPYPPGAFGILILHDVPKQQFLAFERLLLYLLDKHGILTPEEAEARLEDKIYPPAKHRVPYLLTFDDGFKSNVNLAREILNRYGVKAIFFVCPGLIDLSKEKQQEVIGTRMLSARLKKEKIPAGMEFMSWTDMEYLVKEGHTVGSHTLSHLSLSDIDEESRIREIVTPATIIKKKVGIRVKWFAYPYGKNKNIDAHSLKIIRDNYDFCCSALRGINSVKTPPTELRRQGVKLISPFDYQKFVLSGCLDFLYYKKLREMTALNRDLS